jgi:hypothetical protein
METIACQLTDGPHLAFYSLSIDQLFYSSGQTWWLARGQQILCASRHPMQTQGCQLVNQSVHTATS